MKDLKDKLVMVTGSARGLGYSMCEAFAKLGSRIIVSDLNEENCKIAAEKLNKEYGVATDYYVLNVANVGDITEVFESIQAKYGKLDVLVNNAGVQIRNASKEFKEADWDLLMNVNMKGVFFCCQQAAKIMESGAAIVNISSVNHVATTPGKAPYCISKGAVKTMTAVLAAEWAKDGIRVNAIAPGYVLTEMVQDGMNLGVISEKQLLATIPMKRLGKPAEMADLVTFCASDISSYMTGQTLLNDGGMTVQGLPDVD